LDPVLRLELLVSQENGDVHTQGHDDGTEHRARSLASCECRGEPRHRACHPHSATSLSVTDKEVVTLAIDQRTTFTKWITQKPWGEDTRLDARALRVGALVSVHTRRDDGAIADWVQIATDMPLRVPVTVATVARSPVATAGSAQAAASDELRPNEVVTLIANATTRGNHLKLAKHFGAVAARNDAEVAEHVAEAKAYRSAPNPHETKRPGSPATAAHCDRLAEAARAAAKAARQLAHHHAEMAK
jgi:hypothetical protein